MMPRKEQATLPPRRRAGRSADMPMANFTSLFTSERPVAVVYPAFSVNCYGVIRALGEHGVPVLALDDAPNPNFASRYCKSLCCPSPKEDPEAFVAFLAELGERFRTPPVLYMMEDLYVYLAHRYRKLLAPYYRFPFMTDTALLDCIDKRRTFAVAEACDLPLPATWYPGTMADLLALEGELPMPVIIKPVVARFDFQGGRVDKICEFPNRYHSKAVQADSWGQLVAEFARVLELGIACCVQELIPGGQDALYGSTLYVDEGGEVHGIFVRTKLRQTPWDFGTMTLGRAAASPEVVEQSKRLAKAIGFRGICGMEYKRDERDGRYKLLEINPRGELWMNLAQRCGVNLPLLKYQHMVGEPMRMVQTDFDKQLLDLRDDFSLYYMRYRNDVGQDHHVSFTRWLTSILRPGTEEVIFNWRDPLPGLLRYRDYALRVASNRWPARREPSPTLSQVTP